MKTVTEFSGFFLRGALKIRQDLFQKKKQELKTKPKEDEVQLKVEETAQVLESQEQNPEQAEVKEADDAISKDVEVKAEPPPPHEEVTEVIEAATAEEPIAEAETQAEENKTQETASTETEVKSNDQKNNNKKPRGPGWVEVSDEELKASLAESLKLEGEKLDLVLNAIKAVDRKREEDLKRVVVYTLEEGEKQPEGTRLMGTHVFLSEYLASLRPPARDNKKRFDKNKRGRGGKNDKRGGGGKRFDKKGGRPPRHARPGAEGEVKTQDGTATPAGEKKSFRPRKPFVRKPPKPMPEQPPGTLLIKI